MERWPEITEPLLRERQGMSDEEFFDLVAGLLAQVPPRTLDDEQFEHALGYPWERGPEIVREYIHAPDRIPLLAYGANASPERLALKLAHLEEADHHVPVLAAELEDFDVGPAAQGPWFLTMPATLVPSPGTRVGVGVLLLTPAQFTALWWTELSYKVGALDDVVLTTAASGEPIRRVIAFVSRFGAFCVDGEPIVMSAIAARKRRWKARSQRQILDAAARTTLGDGAGARELLTAAYEDPPAFMAQHFAKLRAASQPFESRHWTEMPV